MSAGRWSTARAIEDRVPPMNWWWEAVAEAIHRSMERIRQRERSREPSRHTQVSGRGKSPRASSMKATQVGSETGRKRARERSLSKGAQRPSRTGMSSNAPGGSSWMTKQKKHGLPASRDAFIGRVADLKALHGLVEQGHRHISILGMGGVERPDWRFATGGSTWRNGPVACGFGPDGSPAGGRVSLASA